MINKKEIKDRLRDALAHSADRRLLVFGFTRARNSLIYKRCCGESIQSLDFSSTYLPKYMTNVDVHIHPHIFIRMNRVSDRALAIVNSDKSLLADEPGIVQNIAIESLMKKSSKSIWFASGAKGIAVAIAEIVSFVESEVVSFLAEFKSPDDIIRLYVENDERPLKQNHWFLFVAAAYDLLGDSASAYDVIDKAFVRKGIRKKYQVAFDTLGSTNDVR